ncbi:condensin complex subunit 2-like isoform X1 [Chenopodium quinoa]|uniref:condensin complex subunit 2-like isoform X1 n=1 Tax=Chenopodium quinoa TaxID=63459 RepID=UPI000B78A1F1|nr:condensin complex subunit 2-like isoform X1 [Chenopodium quinoa]
MAETLTPNPPLQKRRASISTRLQSPKSPFFLGSNDDKLERAQARAARAAAVRRKVAEDALLSPPSSPPSNSCLDGDQIMELFRNCIKLASENKINQKNTWELKLIDHLSEIIKVEDEDDAETNFQKASCTLEAGVKIYALRVDSVHSEAYKVLGGISRAGLEDQQETLAGDSESNEQDVDQPKKESEKKLSPLSTLESSFEALNVKKLDVSFAVDPLYHQTTAQFDEGGAKGLLLNNLGIYGGCRVLFDSQEVPAKCISSTNDTNSSNLIDISFVGDCIDQMVTNMNTKKDICPTFNAIAEQLDDNSLQQRQYQSSQDSVCDVDATDDVTVELNGGSEFTSVTEVDDDKGCELDDGSYDHAEACPFDNNDDAYNADECFDISDQHLNNQYEEQEASMSTEFDDYDRFDNVASLLLGVSGITSTQNAWAGPDHWKYRKSKTAGTESVTAQDSELVAAAKRQKTKKASEADINLTKTLDEDLPDIFAPPKNPKSLLLPAKKVPCSNKLPEDCHYHPENLVKLFLLPNVMCLGKRRRRRVTDNESWEEGGGFSGAFAAWDNESAYSGPDNDAHSDIEEQDILISQPRQVNKIEVQYDKTAKQVDVHLLKETLWDHIGGFVQAPETNDHEEAISFNQVLATFPDDCGAAAARDISPHLCFICLLHLANEHGLRIEGCTNMDDLSIHLPVSS